MSGKDFAIRDLLDGSIIVYHTDGTSEEVPQGTGVWRRYRDVERIYVSGFVLKYWRRGNAFIKEIVDDFTYRLASSNYEENKGYTPMGNPPIDSTFYLDEDITIESIIDYD